MVDSPVAEGLTTGIALVLLIVGAAGVILPVLPGSLLIVITLAVWALLLGSTPAWTVAIIGMVLALLGWSAATVLTGRVLRREKIPRGPVLIAIAAALVGMVAMPPLGLFLGFALGLFGAEYLRRGRDVQAALGASLSALRAIGLGILVEFGMAGAAVSCFVIGALIHHLG